MNTDIADEQGNSKPTATSQLTMPPGSVVRLTKVPLREAFPKEASHFTTWLAANIEALSEAVGLELTVVQREQAVGDFNVDLLCEEGRDGRKVIVENQLEKTDHNHLGQLLTYLVNLEASTAIWVAAEPRVEHQKVITWLNDSTAADLSFYLVQVQAARIGNSPFAPLFTVIARPDQQAKAIAQTKGEWAGSQLARYDFWKSLLERSKRKTHLFNNITPSRHPWISTGAGKSGVSFNYTIHEDNALAELYIDYDQHTGEKNKAIFDALFAQREAIEDEFGGSLTWDRLNDKRASRIRKRFNNGGLASPDTWPVLQDNMIDAMIKLEKALRQRLAKITV